MFPPSKISDPHRKGPRRRLRRMPSPRDFWRFGDALNTRWTKYPPVAGGSQIIWVRDITVSPFKAHVKGRHSEFNDGGDLKNGYGYKQAEAALIFSALSQSLESYSKCTHGQHEVDQAS
jgi:hypothetical protein